MHCKNYHAGGQKGKAIMDYHEEFKQIYIER